jgi:hypothetical protein
MCLHTRLAPRKQTDCQELRENTVDRNHESAAGFLSIVQCIEQNVTCRIPDQFPSSSKEVGPLEKPSLNHLASDRLALSKEPKRISPSSSFHLMMEID